MTLPLRFAHLIPAYEVEVDHAGASASIGAQSNGTAAYDLVAAAPIPVVYHYDFEANIARRDVARAAAVVRPGRCYDGLRAPIGTGHVLRQ